MNRALAVDWENLFLTMFSAEQTAACTNALARCSLIEDDDRTRFGVDCVGRN